MPLVTSQVDKNKLYFKQTQGINVLHNTFFFPPLDNLEICVAERQLISASGEVWDYTCNMRRFFLIDFPLKLCSNLNH